MLPAALNSLTPVFFMVKYFCRQMYPPAIINPEDSMSQTRTYRSPAAVIVFTIITCGIYGLYWIYSFSTEMKGLLKKDEISPGLDVLLCILCFPYIIYWAYRYGEFLKQAQIQAGISVENDMPILFLVLALCGVFIVDMAIMQSKLNDLYAKQ